MKLSGIKDTLKGATSLTSYIGLIDNIGRIVKLFETFADIYEKKAKCYNADPKTFEALEKEGDLLLPQFVNDAHEVMSKTFWDFEERFTQKQLVTLLDDGEDIYWEGKKLFDKVMTLIKRLTGHDEVGPPAP